MAWKRIILLSFLLISCRCLFGQTEIADSITLLIEDKPKDTLTVNYCNKLLNRLRGSGNYQEAALLGKEVQRAAKSMRYIKGEAEAVNITAVSYYFMGNYSEALVNYFKALSLYESVKNYLGISKCYNNIGLVYSDQQNFSKALDYHFKALKIREEIKDSVNIASSLNNIGLAYQNNKDYDLALEYHLKALLIHEKRENLQGVAISCGNIGNIFMFKGNPQKSIQYNTQAFKLYSKLDDKIGVATCLYDIGSTYKHLGDYPKAIKYLKQGLEIATAFHLTELIKYYNETLYQVYHYTRDYEKALRFYQNFIQYRDSMFNEETTRRVTQAEMNFEFEKKEAIAKAEQLKQNQLHRVELANQRLQRNGFIAGFVLMLSLAGVSYRSYRNKKKSNTIILKQKEEVEIQKHIVEEKQKEILDSITYAKRIQTAILPPAKLVKEILPNSFVLFRPKDIVAGDFYWMLPTEQGVLFAAADCTGHGVPGALVSVVCNNALNRSVREYQLTDPGQILDSTRRIVIAEFQKSEEEVKDGMDISLCYLTGRTLTWAGANNPLWILKEKTKELLEFKPDKQPIGRYAIEKPFTTHCIGLDEGDVIYIFTDGFADQFGGEKGKKFKYSKLKELLVTISAIPMEQQKHLLNEAFESWRGSHEQIDDVTVIGVRI